MVKIAQSIKTLILEIVLGNGACHIREIHLQVTEFRPEVPQHTVRARLSEMSRSDDLEDRLKAFGNGFYGLYEENKDLCSVVSYPDRGPWGDANYRGNCSGYLVKDLILRFGCQSVFDPAEGSGTVRDVVAGINQFLRKEIEYEGRDLRHGWDILTGRLPERQFDLVWYHPPYWDIVRYSDDPNDLSNCQSLEEFELKLNRSVETAVSDSQARRHHGCPDRRQAKGWQVLPPLQVPPFQPQHRRAKGLIIKVQHHCRSDWKNYGAKNPFLIPIKHEYCLVFRKPECPRPVFLRKHGA